MTVGALARVAVALDTSDWRRFESWCDLFGPRVGVLKVGLEAYVRWGPRAVERAADRGAGIFLDLKLHDIPNTVAGAVAAARDQGVDYLTVHAGGGPAMLAAASEAAGAVRVLGVTVLTHLDPPELAALDLPGTAGDRVERWAALAASAGCAGVVCSPRELARLRRATPADFRLVTPGVRPDFAVVQGDDQKRVATPGQALADGADLLVLGRPLTGAPDPDKALDQLADELEGQATA